MDAEIPDHLPRFDLGAELDARLIRVALAQMRIIIGAFPIKAADAQPPAAILIPAVGLYDPTLHSDNRRADRAEQVIAEMPPAVAVGAGIAEIVIMAVAKAFRDRAIGLQPYFLTMIFWPSCSLSGASFSYSPTMPPSTAVYARL